MLKSELLRYKIHYFFSCFSRLNGLNKTACVCTSQQIGVVTAMTLAEFIMRVSLLLSVGKQACG